MFYRLCALATMLSVLAASDVFQYEVVLPPDAKGKKDSAYLWIPPQAKEIRGLLLGCQIAGGIEDFILEDTIRAACAEVQVGILTGALPVKISDDMQVTDMDRLEDIIKDLATQSGHSELVGAPFMPFGWSAGTVWSSRFAFAFPERCFASMTFKGGFCVPAPGKDVSKVIGMPWLHIQGQFEEFGAGPNGVLRDFEDRSTGGKTALLKHLEFRAANPDLLLGTILDVGATHMGWNPRLYPLVAKFIVSSAKLRLPAAGEKTLRKVALHDGVLMDHILSAPRFPIASAKTYTGPAAEALWFPDQKMAQEVQELHKGLEKKPQYVTICDAKGNPQDVGHDMRFNVHGVTFVGSDTFTIVPQFNDKYIPKKYPPHPLPIGHGEGKPQACPSHGSFEQIDDTKFRIGFRPGRGRGWIRVFHPGDSVYRYAEQILNLKFSAAKGQAQVLTFAPPASVKHSSFPLSLEATSSASQAVRFVVASGPAKVEGGNKLVLAEVPVNAPYPLKISVVAWQAGSYVAPLVSAAEPVRATILVERE